MARRFFCAAVVFSVFSLVVGGPPPAAPKVPALYVFGDSLADVGNNNHLKLSTRKANFPHNGVDFPTKKPTGRFSNGKNAADFIAEKLGVATPPPYLSLGPNSNSAFISGVNFASGGAGVFDADTHNDNFRQTISLSKQVEYYSRVHEGILKGMGSSANAMNHLSRSLFAVVIGSNDILGYLGSPDSSNKTAPAHHVTSMLQSLNTQLKQLYSQGARKFLVAGIGVVGCCPQQRLRNETGGCNEQANYWSVKYNDGLRPMLRRLVSELKGFTYSYLDAYAIMHKIIENPGAYGITDVEAACCGLGRLRARVPCLPIARYCADRDRSLFWDLYHPTEAAARIFVDSLFNHTLNYASPLSVHQLISP